MSYTVARARGRKRDPRVSDVMSLLCQNFIHSNRHIGKLLDDEYAAAVAVAVERAARNDPSKTLYRGPGGAERFAAVGLQAEELYARSVGQPSSGRAVLAEGSVWDLLELQATARVMLTDRYKLEWDAQTAMGTNPTMVSKLPARAGTTLEAQFVDAVLEEHVVAWMWYASAGTTALKRAIGRTRSGIRQRIVDGLRVTFEHMFARVHQICVNHGLKFPATYRDFEMLPVTTIDGVTQSGRKHIMTAVEAEFGARYREGLARVVFMQCGNDVGAIRWYLTEHCARMGRGFAVDITGIAAQLDDASGLWAAYSALRRHPMNPLAWMLTEGPSGVRPYKEYMAAKLRRELPTMPAHVQTMYRDYIWKGTLPTVALPVELSLPNPYPKAAENLSILPDELWRKLKPEHIEIINRLDNPTVVVMEAIINGENVIADSESDVPVDNTR